MLRKKRSLLKNCASLLMIVGRSKSPLKVTEPWIPIGTGT
jgi:hypothetical protein